MQENKNNISMKINLISRDRKMNNESIEDSQFEKDLQNLIKRVEILENSSEDNDSKPIKNENNYLPEENYKKNGSNKLKSTLFSSLILVFFTTMILMTVYEWIKQELHPDITIWQSHTITIIFASIIAPIAAYFAFRKIEILRKQATEEVIEKRKAEKQLYLVNEKLEERVKERTLKISEVNERLLIEIKNRKDAEEEIRKYAEELLIKKDQLQDKTNELLKLNKKLEKSETKLKEMNLSKDKFFSILAHDLRSPFTSLMGLSEFMENELDRLDKADLKLFSAGISKSAKGIYNLLENLLEWSRVQTGRIKCEPKINKLEDIIEDVVSLNNFNILKKHLRLEKFLEPDLEFFGDRKMIETVLRNLISNAIKFTKPKGRIKIQTEKKDSFVQIKISDNGIGIEQNNIEKLFKIDEQVATQGTENEKGTGLGLILCKEFIEKNNGTIWVESEINKGTDFYLSLPYGDYKLQSQKSSG